MGVFHLCPPCGFSREALGEETEVDRVACHVVGDLPNAADTSARRPGASTQRGGARRARRCFPDLTCHVWEPGLKGPRPFQRLLETRVERTQRARSRSCVWSEGQFCSRTPPVWTLPPPQGWRHLLAQGLPAQFSSPISPWSLPTPHLSAALGITLVIV